MPCGFSLPSWNGLAARNVLAAWNSRAVRTLTRCPSPRGRPGEDRFDPDDLDRCPRRYREHLVFVQGYERQIVPGRRSQASGRLGRAVPGCGAGRYKKVFQLLLRLKANCLWPAKHPYSDFFHKHPENPELALPPRNAAGRGSFLLGTGGIGGIAAATGPGIGLSQEEGHKLIDRALGKEGIKVLDTADIYAAGAGERIVGTWNAAHPDADVLIRRRPASRPRARTSRPTECAASSHTASRYWAASTFTSPIRLDPNTPWAESLPVFSHAVETRPSPWTRSSSTPAASPTVVSRRRRATTLPSIRIPPARHTGRYRTSPPPGTRFCVVRPQGGRRGFGGSRDEQAVQGVPHQLPRFVGGE